MKTEAIKKQWVQEREKDADLERMLGQKMKLNEEVQFERDVVNTGLFMEKVMINVNTKKIRQRMESQKKDQVGVSKKHSMDSHFLKDLHIPEESSGEDDSVSDDSE